MSFEGVISGVAGCFALAAAFWMGSLATGAEVIAECRALGMTRIHGQVFVCIKQDAAIQTFPTR